jgi:DNA repair exonuclease SbcCD ATPase subunit
VTHTIEYKETLEVTACWCGINMAAPAILVQKAQREGTTLYCPLGHSFVWTKSENTKLREQLAAEQMRVANLKDDLRTAEYARRAEKAKATRLAKRVHNGVCPECNRTFQNLARHMETQHHAPAEEP